MHCKQTITNFYVYQSLNNALPASKHHHLPTGCDTGSQNGTASVDGGDDAWWNWVIIYHPVQAALPCKNVHTHMALNKCICFDSSMYLLWSWLFCALWKWLFQLLGSFVKGICACFLLSLNILSFKAWLLYFVTVSRLQLLFFYYVYYVFLFFCL